MLLDAMSVIWELQLSCEPKIHFVRTLQSWELVSLFYRRQKEKINVQQKLLNIIYLSKLASSASQLTTTKGHIGSFWAVFQAHTQGWFCPC